MTKKTNLSQVSLDRTARTNVLCARERATNLAILGARKVLELCVGPSLKTHDEVGKQFGLEIHGNDIDPRWRDYYKEGRWLLGDALSITSLHGHQFDAIVFAPPLSRGCTGKREDSLRINEVTPRYSDFLETVEGYSGILTLVLPARSLATKEDKGQLFSLLRKVQDLKREVEVVPLIAGCRKYVDVYIYRNAPNQMVGGSFYSPSF